MNPPAHPHLLLALRRLALSVTALAAAACSQPANTAPTAEAGASPVSPLPLANIESLIGDAGCESDAQCRTIGVGHKPCGGPARYLAWSTLRTEEASLRAAVSQHAAAQRREQLIEGRASTCEVVPDPGAYCNERPGAAGTPGVCRLHDTRGAAGQSAR